MFIVSCGIAYANNYGVNSNENALEISELQGRSYIVSVFLLAGFIPLASPLGFSFDESGNFLLVPFSFLGDYSGSYTQTGTTFSAHCEYAETLNIPHELDFEGTISGIFIYGNFTGQVVIGDGIVIPTNGFFFGIWLLF